MARMLAVTMLMAVVLVVANGQARPAQEPGPVSPRFDYPAEAPGDSKRLPRPWAGAPPLVPHSLDGLLPITREENACTLCHATEGDADGPPAVPASHVLRAAGGGEAALAGNRWVCTSCHVPRSNAPAFKLR